MNRGGNKEGTRVDVRRVAEIIGCSPKIVLNGDREVFPTEMTSKITKPITEEELWDALEDAAMPIDFDKLIAEGLIEPDGAWYKVPNIRALPKHAERKISKVHTGPKGIRVKFRAPRQDAIRLLKRRPKKKANT